VSAVTFLVVVCSLAAAVPLAALAIQRVLRSPRKLTAKGTLVSALLASLSVVWLSFASTYLFWLFPIALLASVGLGYALGSRTSALSHTEVRITLLGVALGGIASAVDFFRTPDNAFGYYPAALLVANYLLFLFLALVGSRRRAVQSA
jgi:hypothetical protein